jgi:hypothetical protein
MDGTNLARTWCLKVGEEWGVADGAGMKGKGGIGDFANYVKSEMSR